MEEDWKILKKFLPKDWEVIAEEVGALKGLRKHKTAEGFLRTLMMHVGCGYSLRETVVRAREAGLGEFSDVALLKRLRKSSEWFQRMCVKLFEEKGLKASKRAGFEVRLFDATHVKEPGKTGSVWRIHYSVTLPFLSCDYFKLTAMEGVGNGEKFSQFPMAKGDYVIADRGYSHAAGIHYVSSKQAYVMVRVNTVGLKICNLRKGSFGLLKKVKSIKRVGVSKSWDVLIPGDDKSYVKGRICAIRKTKEAIKLSQQKLKREAAKKGKSIKPETLEFAKYVIVFTTFPSKDFSTEEVLEWYRSRWQVELVFRRFKSIAQLGHLPKYDEESAKAWLYGKLFVALLVEKLIGYAESISPWGYLMEESATTESMA